MTYEAALEYIASLSSKGWRLGLDRMQAFATQAGLASNLGSGKPQFIHVAGTNGKGSTTAFLQSLMVGQGYRTGAFFSPYVIDPRERVQINRDLISRELLAKLTSELRQLAEEFEKTEWGGPTEFEFKTALGFAAWAHEKCEWVALEVGLGGRLDATNVVQSAASVIVSIGLDHTAILGDTHGQIAFEKAGIIKPGVPVIVGEVNDEAWKAIEAVAIDREAPIWRLGREIEMKPDGDGWTVRNPLAAHRFGALGIGGAMQDHNAALAISAMDAAGAIRDPGAVAAAIAAARIPGRFQRVQYQGREWILDGSHNAEAGGVLRRSLLSHLESGRSVVLVTNMLSGHDVPAFYDTLQGLVSQVHVVPVSFPRALTPEAAAEVLRSKFDAVTSHGSVEEGMKAALRSAVADATILVTGSNYLVGEVARVIGLQP